MAIHIVKQCPDDMLAVLADAHFGLACVATQTNAPESCMSNATKALEIHQQVAQKGRLLSIYHNEVGAAYCMQEKWEEGLTHFYKTLQLCKELPEYMSKGYRPLFAEIHIAYTLACQGRADEAAERIELLLQWRESQFGPMDTDSC